MASTIARIQQSIIDRLSPLRQVGFLVRSLPNKSAEYGEIVGNGVVTVSWSKDDASPPSSVGFFRQQIIQDWILDIRIRELWGDAGAMLLRDAIYEYLIGFQPDGAGKMYARSYGFTDRKDAYWHFEATFQCPVHVLQIDPIQGESLPRLRSLFLQGEINEVAIGEEYQVLPGLDVNT